MILETIRSGLKSNENPTPKSDNCDSPEELKDSVSEYLTSTYKSKGSDPNNVLGNEKNYYRRMVNLAWND